MAKKKIIGKKKLPDGRTLEFGEKDSEGRRFERTVPAPVPEPEPEPEVKLKTVKTEYGDRVILFDVNERQIKIPLEEVYRYLKMGYRKEIPPARPLL